MPDDDTTDHARTADHAHTSDESDTVDGYHAEELISEAVEQAKYEIAGAVEQAQSDAETEATEAIKSTLADSDGEGDA